MGHPKAFKYFLPLMGPTLLLLSVPASAAPTAIKLSWASADAATTTAVSWVTQSQSPSTIEYGVQGVGENMLTGAPATNVAGIGWYHEVELTALMPDTAYRYRVGSAGDWSGEHSFETAPNDGCTAFSFAALGDARSQNDRGPSLNWSSIHAEAEAAGAKFFLNSGDLVKDGNQIDQWAQWLTDSEMVNPGRAMLPALGNHDDGPGFGHGANYNRLFTLPTNTVTGTEDYYYVVYNNLLIFSLSTQSYQDWAVQMQWMMDIAAQHPTKWKIAFFHHPVFTTQTRAFGQDVSHGPNEKGQNAAYAPAFDTAGIDIVLQSHNHVYERFAPLRYDPTTLTEGQEVATYGNGPNDGRLYVISGGSGAFLDPLIEGRFQDFAIGSTTRSKDHHFVRISVSGSTLHYQAIRTNAGNSSGGGSVIDELTLQRPGKDPCLQPGDPDDDMDGYPASVDCRDDVFDINPGATEICGNQVDENCDMVIEDCPPPPVDMDMDGSPEGTDCDDSDPDRFPEHPEQECDGKDNDCDCFEVCDGVQSDVCNPPVDAGPPDAAPQDSSLPPPPRDAGPADTGPVDAANVNPLAAEDCSCTSTRSPNPSWASGILLIAGLCLRRRRPRSQPLSRVRM